MTTAQSAKARYVWTPSGPVLKALCMPKINPKSQRFGQLLKGQRKALRLTQQEAADKVGVTRECFGLYERGSRLPATRVLVRMAAQGFSMEPLVAVITEGAQA